MQRRQFLGVASAGPLLTGYQQLAAAEKKRVKIRDVRVMVLQGFRTFNLVKIVSDDGLYGIAEAYGSPGVGVKEQILSLKPWLVGKDPLEIDVLYTEMGKGTHSLAGTRTDGSAHNLMRAVSGIEMALWDLSGKILGVPSTTLLGGKFRDKVKVYQDSGPKNPLDKASCNEWAQQVKANPSGFTAHKFGFRHAGIDPPSRVLTTRALIDIRQMYENCREAIGWDHDIIAHCHWEYDLRTSIQIAEAVEPIKPLWLEDPLPVAYSGSWPRLCASSRVPILTGENLTQVEGFKDFIINQGCDIVNPDLRNTGGFLETKRIADLAHLFGIPMCSHNSGSQVHTYAAVQFAGAIPDFMALETMTGRGGWMDQVLLLDGEYIKNGYIQVNDNKPGLGIELNPDVVKAHLAPGEVWWG